MIGKEFVRLCRVHRKPLTVTDADTLLCPIGHIVEGDDFEVASTKTQQTVMGAVARAASPRPDPTKPSEMALPLWKPKPLVPLVAVEEERVVMGSKGTGTSRLIDSQSFHSLGGHRMFVYLESAKSAPFVVRVRMVDDGGKARQGVVETCTTEESGREAFARRLLQAEQKGWRVGRPRRDNALTDIPDAPTSVPSPRAVPKRRGA